MTTIVTRAGKGSALTWTEGDANITNLNNDKIEAVVDDTTPQLGGNLDVNGNSIVSTSNGNISITPNGSGSIVLDGLNWPQADGTADQVLKTNGSGQLSWTTASGGGASTLNDLTDVDTSGAMNGHVLTYNSTGSNWVSVLPSTGATTLDELTDVSASSPTNGQVLTYNSSLVRWEPVTISGGSGTVTSVSGTGTVSGITLTGTVTSSGSLTLGGTLDLSSPPAIGATSAAAGTFTNLSSTGTLTFKNPIEAIYDLGTTGGTIAPDCANGSVQKITLNSALTINGFTNATAGESLTLIIYGDSSYTSITSTMKFAGGDKTLTGTAGCIDILSVYYDGTNYFASLGKGFA